MRKVVHTRRAIRAAIEGLESRILLSTYLVINNADSGTGSLRQAITDSNNAPGSANEIDFAIGSGQQVITLGSPLPAVTVPVDLNGRTQPGYAGTPLVQINGYGLSISAGNSTVEGLDIVSTNQGSLITLARFGNNKVAGNYLGTDLSGNTAVGNAQYGIYDADTGNNLIGGPTLAQRNVISGAAANPHSSSNPGSPGIYIFGLDAKNNQIQGNYIGTNASGMAAVPNVVGIEIDNQASGNVIGGTSAGTGNLISGNSFVDVLVQNYAFNNFVQGNVVGLNAAGNAPISANANTTGVDIEYSKGNVIGGESAGAGNVISGHLNGIYFYAFPGSPSFNSFNTAQGNYIGTDVTGLSAVPNTYGVVFNSQYNTVGGTNAADRNVISGNQIGVQIFEAQGSLQGNYIGLNAAGKPLGNTQSGVLISTPGASVGGAAAGAGNVISANQDGIVVTASSASIQGNRIGTDPTGASAMGNSGNGVFVSNAGGATIGGAAAGAGNVISGNQAAGVRISGGSTNTGTIIQGNYIGTNPSGAAIGNAQAGVSIQGAAGTTVGGAAGNIIAFNAGNGIEVIGATATSNTLSRNSIYANGGIGIDLGADGPTPNHLGGSVSGPNALLNRPVLTSAAFSPNATNVTGTFSSAPSSAYTIEFFATPYGSGTLAGKTYLGSVTAAADSNGNAAFSAALAATPTGQTITATATDATGDTSEFATPIGAAAVMGRRIFYNNSAYDQNNTALNAADDDAIAPDKQALLPGQTAAFANYTNFTRGINGVMIDVGNLPAATLSSADFSFRAGATANPAQWTSAPVPTAVQVRPGAGTGGSARIEFTFADGTLRNQWLQVTLNADAATALGVPDVFYFGNLIGESGKGAVNGQFVDTPADMTAVLNDPHPFFNAAIIGDPCDFNRDGVVNGIDELIARMDSGGTLPALQPAASPLAAVSASAALQPMQAQTASTGPTAQEQYAIELINRARANPAAEAALDGINLNEGLPAGTIPATPVQPLAINPDLVQSAEMHSQWMLANQTLSHNEGSLDPATRMADAGYVFNPPSGSGENVDLRATAGVLVPNTTIVQQEQDLFTDSSTAGRSHRLNLLNPAFAEVGTGLATGAYGSFNAMFATQDFAYSSGGGPFLTGAAFNDARIHDNFYEPGEGLGGVSISAKRASDGAVFSTTTWAAGGYTLALPAGTYTVTASGAGFATAIVRTNVVVTNKNVQEDFTPASGAYVAGRYVFYNASAFDQNNAAANAADDNAIATDKQALLPGTPASFVNYTSYTQGINGIMADLGGLPAGTTLKASDFSFAVSSNGASWSAAPASTAFLVRAGAGAGGSTRVEFTFANGSIRNEWLQVTIAANADTGLSAPDVFYFGNAIGESGDNPANAKVDSADMFAVLSDPHTTLNPATITNPHDYNRDGRVDAIDELIARMDSGFALTLFTPADPVTSSAASTAPSLPAITPPSLDPTPIQDPRSRLAARRVRR